MVDTDVVQTAADRFHHWLLNMALIVQELCALELESWHKALEHFQSNPEQAHAQPIKKASEWAELMHELQIFQSSFTRMLFGDQLIAVRDFEISTRVRREFDEHGELVPTDVEVRQKSLPGAFSSLHVRHPVEKHFRRWLGTRCCGGAEKGVR